MDVWMHSCMYVRTYERNEDFLMSKDVKIVRRFY